MADDILTLNQRLLKELAVYIKLGGSWRFKQEDVAAWIETHKNSPK